MQQSNNAEVEDLQLKQCHQRWYSNRPAHDVLHCNNDMLYTQNHNDKKYVCYLHIYVYSCFMT